VPSVAPHATAVGGTAIVNVPGKSTFESLGWGDDVNAIIVGTPVVPPTLASLEAFFGGGGGGESRFWAKPAWQRALPGTGRQTPDISALSDPYTGVPIVITKNHTQQVSVGWGGTSLACPIFTAIWAISDQRAGRPLGQAAPTIARLTSGVTDVLPGTTDGFSGSITGPKGTTKYTSGQLFAQLHFRQKEFLPTIWNIQFDSFVIALGGDTSLTVGTGWDNVTGYGTPAGLSFIDAAAAY
jgi:subtilase family serine protease